jgi:hypothetical protein
MIAIAIFLIRRRTLTASYSIRHERAADLIWRFGLRCFGAVDTENSKCAGKSGGFGLTDAISPAYLISSDPSSM